MVCNRQSLTAERIWFYGCHKDEWPHSWERAKQTGQKQREGIAAQQQGKGCQESPKTGIPKPGSQSQRSQSKDPKARIPEPGSQSQESYPRPSAAGALQASCLEEHTPGVCKAGRLSRRVTRCQARLQIPFIVIIANAPAAVKIKLRGAEIRVRPTPREEGVVGCGCVAAAYHRDAERMENTSRAAGGEVTFAFLVGNTKRTWG